MGSLTNTAGTAVTGIKDKSTPIGFTVSSVQENTVTNEVTDEQTPEETNPGGTEKSED